MKNRNKLIKGFAFSLISGLMLMGLNACKKDEATNVLNPGDYLNLNIGSSWNYSTTGSATTAFKVTAEDSMYIYKSLNYRLFKTNTAGAITRNYYNYKNGNYSVLVMDADGTMQDIVYLKDSTQVGKRWSKSIKGAGGIMKAYNYEVIDNNNKTVAGTNYTQVVHVRLTIPSTAYTSDAYYAPKIGLILSDDDYASSGSNYHTELTSHTLK